MSCFNNNYLPNPPRTWSRVQSSWSVTTNIENNGFVKVPYTNNLIPVSLLGEKIAMLNKGNILQYKANSSNLTQAQKYSKIAQGKWTNRNTTWATQSTRGYTNPNNSSLKRSGNVVNVAIDPITGAIIGPTAAPVTCPKPIIPVNEGLPSNGGGGSVDEPEIPPPVEPTPASETFPPTIPDTPIEPTVIQDEGILICSIQENICTGEIKVSLSQQLCNPTSDSDVPGTIQLLCWDDGTPTWYPRQRYTMTNSTTVMYDFKYNVAPTTPIIELCESCDSVNKTTQDNYTVKEIISYTNNILSTPLENINIELTITQLNTYLEKLELLRDKCNCNSGMIDNYAYLLKLIFILSMYSIDKNNAVSTAEKYKNDSNILNNQTLLQEWIDNNNNKANGLFGDVKIKTLAVTLKPEYLEYHTLYGIPTNLLYDTELLTDIKTKIYNK